MSKHSRRTTDTYWNRRKEKESGRRSSDSKVDGFEYRNEFERTSFENSNGGLPDTYTPFRAC